MSVFGTKQTFQPYPRMQSHVPDEAFEVVHKQFLEKEIVDLTATVGRAIAFRVPPQVESKMAAAYSQPIRFNPFAYRFQRCT